MMEDSPTCPGTEELLDVSSQGSQATKNMDLTVLPLALVAILHPLMCTFIIAVRGLLIHGCFMVTDFQHIVLGVGVGS